MRVLLAKKYNININDDFKLLEQIGRDCAGAISFHKIDEPQKLQQLIKIEGKILSNQELKKYIEELPYRPYMGKRLSLAGAQEKTAICVMMVKLLYQMMMFQQLILLKLLYQNIVNQFRMSIFA